MVTVMIIGALLYPILGIVVPVLLIWFQRLFGFPRNVKTGAEALAGKTAEVDRVFAWNDERNCFIGRVKLGSEIWSAACSDEQITKVAVGDEVLVDQFEHGLLLRVERFNIKE